MNAARIGLGVLLLWTIALVAWSDGVALQFQVGHKSTLEYVHFSADGSRSTSVDSRGRIKI